MLLNVELEEMHRAALSRCAGWLCTPVSNSMSTHGRGDLSQWTLPLRGHRWLPADLKTKLKVCNSFLNLVWCSPCCLTRLILTHWMSLCSSDTPCSPKSLPPQTFPNPPEIWWSCPCSYAFLALATSPCTCHDYGRSLTHSRFLLLVCPLEDHFQRTAGMAQHRAWQKCFWNR